MPKGGARPNAGRKSKIDESRVQAMALKSLVTKYGSEEDAFTALLDSKEPSLIKFAYEHAFGRPKEKVAIEDHKITLVIKRGSRITT